MHMHVYIYMKKDHQSEPLIVVVNCRHVVISLCRFSHYIISYQCTINSTAKTRQKKERGQVNEMYIVEGYREIA